MNEYFLFWKDVEWQQLQAEYYAKQAFCTLCVPQCLIIYKNETERKKVEDCP